MTVALTHRPFIWAALAIVASCAACATHGPDVHSPRAEKVRQIEPDLGIVPPQGLEDRAVALWPDDKKGHAELPLSQILPSLPKPAFLADTDQTDTAPSRQGPRPKTRKLQSEPPLMAQQHYLAARLAWREGLRYDAIRKLHLARRVAPNDPQILRFLGRIYDEQANKDQSYRYFEQAAEHDPTDPYTLFMLARHSLDQGRPEAAIAILGHLITTLKVDAPSPVAFRPLVHFYLGNALARTSHDLAAIDQWHNYLSTRVRFDRLSRQLRDEAFMLHRNQRLIWQRLGDAYNRLGQPDKALDAYQHAKVNQVPGQSLTQRLVFTLLRLRQDSRARQTAIDLLAQNHDDSETLALVSYLAQTRGESAQLVAMMHPLYLQHGRPGPLLLAMAQLLNPAERAKLLVAHLAAKPADHVVFEYLVRQRLAADGNANAAADALRATASAITLFEQATDVYVSVLLRHAPDHDALLRAFDALSVIEQKQTKIRYLRGRMLAALGRAEPANEVYRQVIADEPSFKIAHLALIQLLIDHGQFDDAATELAAMTPHTEPAVAALHVRVLSETGRNHEANRHLDEVLAIHPTHEDLLLLKASLRRKGMDLHGCESALKELLNAHPTAERAYEALIDLYSEDQLTDRKMRFKHLWKQLRRHVPHGRVARRERARHLLTQKDPEFATAKQLLHDLLNESPMDHRSMQLLLALLIASDRDQDAESLLDKRLSQSPTRRTFQALANDLYALLAAKLLQAGQTQAAIELVDRALHKPLTDPRSLVLVQQRALLDADQRDQIEPKLRQTIERFPAHEADLLFHWAMALERLNEHDHAEQVMVELIIKHPDHAPANNSLGYTWADRDKNLQRAQDMIQRALVTEPLNSAYLDSLGWVYYKLGRFQEAVEQLSKATMQPLGKNPLIFDHLGDALFRLNRSAEAARYWRDALKGITPQMIQLDPEMQRLSPRVQVKLRAIKTKGKVPVASSPGAATTGVPSPDPPDAGPPMDADRKSSGHQDITPMSTKP